MENKNFFKYKKQIRFNKESRIYDISRDLSK